MSSQHKSKQAQGDATRVESTRRATRRSRRLQEASSNSFNVARAGAKQKRRRVAVVADAKRNKPANASQSSDRFAFVREAGVSTARRLLSSNWSIRQLRALIKRMQGPRGSFVYFRRSNKWIQVSKITSKDAVEYLLETLRKPAQFLIGALAEDPRRVFAEGRLTGEVAFRKGFWQARTIRRRVRWWPDDPSRFLQCFDSVVHIVQPESGTGVHIGKGYILTCAHVVCADEDDDSAPPSRVGRVKFVMFPSGKMFPARCVHAKETSDGQVDCALLKLEGSPTVLSALPSTPVAKVGADVFGTHCFCVGNPSNIDLESKDEANIDFEPKCWHLTVGKLHSVSPNAEIKGTIHTCWTYWGHSGAPIFSAESDSGNIVGMHSSWDDETGARISVSLPEMRKFIVECEKKIKKKLLKVTSREFQI